MQNLRVIDDKLTEQKPLMLHIRFKLEDSDKNLVGVSVSCRYDYQVDLETFKELVELGLVAEYSINPDGSINGKSISTYESSPFYVHGDTEGFVPRGKLKTVDDAKSGLIKLQQEIDADTIDLRFVWGQHIPIVCSGCGARYHTKNIGRIGARSIFTDSPADDECNCDNGKLRILNDAEFGLYLIAKGIEM